MVTRCERSLSAEYARLARGSEAQRSLAEFLGVTLDQALAMLAEGTAAAEIRCRLDPPTIDERRRALERRYLDPSQMPRPKVSP
jgi:hypothetical protein